MVDQPVSLLLSTAILYTNKMRSIPWFMLQQVLATMVTKLKQICNTLEW